MFFRTTDECVNLARGFGWEEAELRDLELASVRPPGCVVLSFQHALADSFQLAHAIARVMPDREPCVLWVKEYGIWASLDNRHLYYRVRQSYGDRRSVTDAPGHQFVDYEYADLVLFLELTMRLGWGAVVFGSRSSPACFVSHDGWVKLIDLTDAEEDVSLMRESTLFVDSPPAGSAPADPPAARPPSDP